ncbi:CvpA family protein [Bacillaceae bacterium S4-13-58]
MIDLILLLILIFGVFTGLKRGFILQLFHLTSFIIAFIVAVVYYDRVAPVLEMWIPYPSFNEGSWALFLDSLPLEYAFYNGIAFFAIFFVVKIFLHIIASMIDFIAHFPILRQANGLLGGILGFIETYFLLFIFLYLVALLPVGFIQDIMKDSSIAKFMIEHTPVVSKEIKSLWFEQVSGFFDERGPTSL